MCVMCVRFSIQSLRKPQNTHHCVYLLAHTFVKAMGMTSTEKTATCIYLDVCKYFCHCVKCHYMVVLFQVILQETVQTIIPQAMLACSTRVSPKDEQLAPGVLSLSMIPTNQVKNAINFIDVHTQCIIQEIPS